MKGAMRSVVSSQRPLGIDPANDLLFHLSPWVIAAITGVEVSVVHMEVSMVDLEDRSKRKSIRWMN